MGLPAMRWRDSSLVFGMPRRVAVRLRFRSKLRRYPTDLTDEEWLVIAPLLPQPREKGRPRKTDLREVVNAIRYLVRTGCGWEMLPSDFPPWQTVYWWFRRFVRLMLFQTIHDIAGYGRGGPARNGLHCVDGCPA